MGRPLQQIIKMTRILILSTFLFLAKIGSAQSGADLIGTWNYQSATTTNSDCKDADEFPISTFIFEKDGRAKFHSTEGVGEASYMLKKESIVLFDLIENGERQAGASQMLIRKLDEKELVLSIKYECGSVDLLFQKEDKS